MNFVVIVSCHLLFCSYAAWYQCQCLSFSGVMALLRPLLLDVVPTIQQTAALALGRLANYNDDLAEAVVRADILPQLVYSLAEQNVSTFNSVWIIWNS